MDITASRSSLPDLRIVEEGQFHMATKCPTHLSEPSRGSLDEPQPPLMERTRMWANKFQEPASDPAEGSQRQTVEDNSHTDTTAGAINDAQTVSMPNCLVAESFVIGADLTLSKEQPRP